MYQLIIDRSRWARGGKGGFPTLLNNKNNMCCLGFLCTNLCKVPLEKLLIDDPNSDRRDTRPVTEKYNMPSQIPSDYIQENARIIDDLRNEIPDAEDYPDIIKDYIDLYDNSIEYVFQNINDNRSISDEVREKLLTKHFKQLLDIEVKFV